MKTDAMDIRNERRARGHREPGWCPLKESQQARAQAKEAQRRERARVSFADHTKDFIGWAKVNHRSWAKDDSRLSRVIPALGSKKLDEITTADVERFLASLREGKRPVSAASVNRYRDLLSGLFKRAIRLGLVAANPVRGIPKLREAGRRLTYLPPDGVEESELLEALPPELRPLFTVSLHTGLRWSEQIGLRWRDVDSLNGVITVERSKNGTSRRVQMNRVVSSVLVDLATQRKGTYDPDASIFSGAYRTAARSFSQAVSRAQASLRAAGKDASKLDGYTWHSNRHTFASRLVMTGADLRTVQELGGWKTLSMVQRYSHLSRRHLQAAVDRLVPQDAPELARN